MRPPTISIGTLVLAALLVVASGSEGQAKRNDPFAGLRASLNDLFTPPHRSRRARAKRVRTPAREAPVTQTQPASPKAGSSKPKAADQKPPPTERARAPAAAEKPPQRGAARPQAAPHPAAPERRSPPPQARREEGLARPPSPAKRASGGPAKDPAVASNRPASEAHEQQGEAPRQGERVAALPPPTKRAFKPPKDPAVASNRPASQVHEPQPEVQRQEGRVAALPPPTKRAYGDPQKAPAAEPEEAEPAPPPPPSACQQRLASGEANAVATIQPRVSVGQCVVDDVVRLEAVMAADGRRIAVAPPATLRCPMAEAVVQWLRDDVAPVARELGAGLKAVVADTSFECRSRNHVAGAKLSEHGHANAIDLRGITLADGTVFRFTDAAADRAARESLRKSACARFTTVLGPGSDGYHETHIHLDLAQRRGGYRLCQWDVRDPTVAVIPLPPERPSSAPPR